MTRFYPKKKKKPTINLFFFFFFIDFGSQNFLTICFFVVCFSYRVHIVIGVFKSGNNDIW